MVTVVKPAKRAEVQLSSISATEVLLTSYLYIHMFFPESLHLLQKLKSHNIETGDLINQTRNILAATSHPQETAVLILAWSQLTTQTTNSKVNVKSLDRPFHVYQYVTSEHNFIHSHTNFLYR